MPSILQKILLGAPLTCLASGHASTNSFDSTYKIDVHSHAVPSIWKEELISAGYSVKNGTLYTDGFPVPDWTLDSHISTMDSLGVNYTTISVSAPGVFFLKEAQKAKSLARSINLLLHSYTQTHPTRLGALCLLPLPFVDEAVEELKFCLDILGFVGVGLFTNSNGTYLGDSILDPIFSALETRNASVFVHPAAPGCISVAVGHPIPMTEYPFDTVRAIENLLLTGQRAQYPNIKMIFAHGGGAIPFLATRIAGMASLPSLGGLSVPESLAQLAGYYFDTAASTSAIQLAALKSFVGADQIVTGSDYPYVPFSQAKPALSAIEGNGDFTTVEMDRINNQNALAIFPRVIDALKLK
ncbi:Amidohydrolase 2 [Penicillium coprophilum]|uniref:Amidohydrolase 2 n=1 Tax=Penicillium coprophilum TaxID=36646 RepID=UPI00239CCA26|nr:Amidohydrolase 2 [Penicillium coprophilum]KAJ5177581.1 Amidohydrolase 2 [Penicillium coprophilum]